MSVPKTKQMVASDVATHSIDFSFGIPLVRQWFTAFFCSLTSQKRNENLTWLSLSPRVWGDKDD